MSAPVILIADDDPAVRVLQLRWREPRLPATPDDREAD